MYCTTNCIMINPSSCLETNISVGKFPSQFFRQIGLINKHMNFFYLDKLDHYFISSRDPMEGLWMIKFSKRNWVFATNSNFLIPISFQPYSVNLWYFKFRFFYPTEFKVWNIKDHDIGLQRYNFNPYILRLCNLIV